MNGIQHAPQKPNDGRPYVWDNDKFDWVLDDGGPAAQAAYRSQGAEPPSSPAAPAPVAAPPPRPAQRPAAPTVSVQEMQQHAARGLVTYANQYATRNQPVSNRLNSVLQQAARQVGIDEVRVFSGGQPSAGGRRTGSHRHDNGNAADIHLMVGGRELNFQNPADLPRIQAFVTAARQAGATGIGAGETYMGPTALHVGFGAPSVWGAGGAAANAPDWLRTAYNATPSAVPMAYAASAQASDPTALAINPPPAAGPKYRTDVPFNRITPGMSLNGAMPNPQNPFSKTPVANQRPMSEADLGWYGSEPPFPRPSAGSAFAPPTMPTRGFSPQAPDMPTAAFQSPQAPVSASPVSYSPPPLPMPPAPRARPGMRMERGFGPFQGPGPVTGPYSILNDYTPASMFMFGQQNIQPRPMGTGLLARLFGG